jgi:predicted  nucleic acid-binding Zn-ribbon protein
MKVEEIESIQCPVCGYYCLGHGGHGCIDKPSMVKDSEISRPQSELAEAKKEAENAEIKRQRTDSEKAVEFWEDQAGSFETQLECANKRIERYQEDAESRAAEIANLRAKLEKAEATIPEDVRSFIYTVTLFLQSSRSKTPEQMDRMFQRSYKLYAHYGVEGSFPQPSPTRNAIKQSMEGK